MVPAVFFFVSLFLRGSYRGFDQQDSGNGTAGDPRSFSVEGGRMVGEAWGVGREESVDKSAEMEREEGRQAACLTPTGTLRVGGG